MFKNFYTWCTSLGAKLEGTDETNDLATDFQNYYTAYFEETSICGTIFLIAAVVGVVMAAAYYFGACNFVFKLAKRWWWALVMVVVFGATFFITRPVIVGTDGGDGDTSTGIFLSSYITESEQLEYIGEDENAQNEVSDVALQFREQFLPKGEDLGGTSDSLPTEMALANGVYAVLIFFLLSILYKRFTTHGSAIPF